MGILSDPEKRAEFIFGQKMFPCPKCKSYDLIYQAPIKMEDEVKKDDSVKQILGKWARATKKGQTPLQGPVYLMCRSCFHKGPSVDCSGRTSEDIGQDSNVSTKVKQLWNEQ